MITLINDEKPPVVEQEQKTVIENGVSELDKMLSQYQAPLTVNNPVSAPQPTGTIQQPTPTPQHVEYYKTGKKAGQPKPQRKTVVSYTPPPNMQVTGELISGALFVTLVDLFFPMLISLLHNLVSKKVKIEYSDLQLTNKQKDQLSPVADKIIKQLKIDANPLLIGGIAYTGMLGIQVMAARQLAEIKAKENAKKNGNQMGTN
jgi:hypothetical protein